MNGRSFPSGVPEYEEWTLKEPTSDCVVIVPVLNEGERLSAQLRDMKNIRLDHDLVVVDGGSTDGSTNLCVLRELGVGTLIQTTCPGLSRQLRAAFHFCLEQGYSFIVTIDGNGKDGVEGVPRVLHELREGRDFVQGSRFLEGGRAENTPMLRYFGIRLIHAPLTSLAARRKFTDSTNGFRGFSRRMLLDPRIAIFRPEFENYELVAYLPIAASRTGFSITEVPVRRVYPRSGRTPTKIRGLRSNLSLIGVLIRVAFGAFGPVHQGFEEGT